MLCPPTADYHSGVAGFVVKDIILPLQGVDVVGDWLPRVPLAALALPWAGMFWPFGPFMEKKKN